MDSQHLRAIILKVQNLLSDDDRQRLHFFLGNDVPRRFRDDPTLRGTLNLMESLFDQDKISEDDFTFLINTFDEIHCTDAVKLLREHMRKIQMHGQHQSIQSLTSILLQDQQEDEEDKCAYRNQKCFSSIITRNDTKWKQDGITIAGGYGEGNQFNQFNHSFGIRVNDDDQTVYITDFNNHRVIEWKFSTKNVEVIVSRNGDGYQLFGPTDVIVDQKNDSLIICDAGNRRVVRWSRQNRSNQQILITNVDCYGLAMDNNGHLYVSDYVKNEIRRWRDREEDGIIVAGGNRAGKNHNQLDRPGYIFVNDIYAVYVSDRNNHRVMKWIQGAKEGSVVAGGHGEGKNFTQLASPQGLTVDKLGNTYVADLRNHRIMRWMMNAKEGRVIAGGNGEGQEANQLLYPTGMSWDLEGNLYVADCSNNRVQKFDIDID